MAELKNLIINNNGYLKLPDGSTTERVGAGETFGMLRYNSDFDILEVKSEGFHNNSRWLSIDKTEVEPVVLNNLILYLDMSSTLVHSDAGGSPNLGQLYTMSYYGYSFDNFAVGTQAVPYDSEVDGCFNFDGNGQLMTAAHNAWQNPSALTISAWVKPTALSNLASQSMNIIGKGANFGYRLRIQTDGKINWFDRGNTNVVSTSTPVITAGNWYFITATASPSGLKIYLNGSLLISNTTAFAGNTDTTPLTIGAADSTNAFSESFYGKMGLILFYNKELSSSDILKNYNSTKGRFGL